MNDDLFAPSAMGRAVVRAVHVLAELRSDDLDAVEVKTKAKQSSTSPTKRSLAHLRKQGCVAVVVEHWNSYARIRQDLFGIIDVIALSPDGVTIGVQSCALSSVSKRVDKITESEHLAALRKCGWQLLVHGWGKGADGKIRLREVDLS